MERINFKHLDIPIIRSCNLDCVGCITHSNHKNIKGLVNLDESLDWLKFWATKLDPNSVTIFGGEPLLHPDFANWAVEMRKIWGPRPQIKVNTNGYYLDKLIDNVELLFNEDVELSVVVSIQTANEPYLSTVRQKSQILKDKILEYRKSRPNGQYSDWKLWDHGFDKFWYNLETRKGCSSNINFVIAEMHSLPWCTHYLGHGETMVPVYDYNENYHEENHKWCQAKEYITLYKGDLYKCPPIGVLEHTLTTFKLENSPDWNPYLKGYKKLVYNSTDAEIENWLNVQKTPENVCNMCGFTGPKSVGQNLNRSHVLKTNWNYKIQN